MKGEVVALARRHVRFTTTAGLLLVASVCLYRYIHWMIIPWCFIAGIIPMYFILSPGALLPNLMYFHTRKKKEPEVIKMHKACPVCGEDTCERHRPELNIVVNQPWTELKIPRKVDSAIEQFLNLVLENFVYTWYRDLSQDEAFVDELRTSLRFIVAVFLRRLKKVDLPSIITDKLIKAGMRHLQICMAVKDTGLAKDDGSFQRAVLSYYGPYLHCAMVSRNQELQYLRKVTENLFPHILSERALQSKSLCSLLREVLAGSVLLPGMDKIAEPDFVNNLLLVFVDPEPPPENPDLPTDLVCILANFSKVKSKNQSALRPELKEILDNTELLFPFMQFLKAEGAVNVLQFYFALEDFNKKLIRPELSDADVCLLHKDILHIYNSYCAEGAFDKIQLAPDIVSEIKEVVESPPDQVKRLQRSSSMFRAFDHAYDLLEETFLPLFLQSNDYYTSLCGERLQNKLQRSNNRQSKRKQEFLGKFGHRLKGVFKNDTIDGKMPDEMQVAESVDEVDPVLAAGDEEGLDIPDSYVDYQLELDGGAAVRDLSAWRVTIPSVAVIPDSENSKKQSHAFKIHINRIDIPDGGQDTSSWSVYRKYNDFYMLEQKLREFHGVNLKAQLPQKKSFGLKGLEYLDSKRQSFEEYVQELLQSPHLKGSELLCNFLESKGSFKSQNDLSIGKVFKSVPMKLTIERGQHLDPFLQSLYASTEAPKPKPSSVPTDPETASVTSISSERLSNPLYENNANLTTVEDLECLDQSIMEDAGAEVTGVFDSILYVAKYVYHAPEWFHHVLITARILGKNSLETFVDWFIGKKLWQVSQEHRIESLVHLLQDALFFDNDPPRTDEQKAERRDQALKELNEFFPEFLKKAVGSENFHHGTYTIFHILQQPLLNKQLSYVMLDIVLQELFPEIEKAEDFEQ
ncbi:sorting nexin-14 isoform X2 [Lingula anatina]|uniref:Sorting nexin-14 isoform X2 n=1 Tax=Lingula anatina TaxID=7574 RepID=A0A1S3HE54_LINAN|nr:sorting nexin-14 isoform X2 [Lingula anatina]|eukprot:XP_013383349.1 sorting nexin-14 isoform X2 [Lingula anatina]